MVHFADAFAGLAAHTRSRIRAGILKHLQHIGTRAFFRPTGQASFEQAIELFAEAILVAGDFGPGRTVMEYFEQVGTRGFFRPIGAVSFERAVDMVAEAMRHARSLGLIDLVANTTMLTGFPSPSVFARYAMATKWAENTGSTLRVALVANAEVVDPQRIGVLMMQNRGGNGDVFTSEADALAWLNSRLAPGERPGMADRARAED